MRGLVLENAGYHVAVHSTTKMPWPKPKSAHGLAANDRCTVGKRSSESSHLVRFGKDTMRRKSVKQARVEEKKALSEALEGLEGVRMTRSDDPKLSALKDDIRRQ